MCEMRFILQVETSLFLSVIIYNIHRAITCHCRQHPRHLSEQYKAITALWAMIHLSSDRWRWWQCVNGDCSRCSSSTRKFVITDKAPTRNCEIFANLRLTFVWSSSKHGGGAICRRNRAAISVLPRNWLMIFGILTYSFVTVIVNLKKRHCQFKR